MAGPVKLMRNNDRRIIKKLLQVAVAALRRDELVRDPKKTAKLSNRTLMFEGKAGDPDPSNPLYGYLTAIETQCNLLLTLTA